MALLKINNQLLIDIPRIKSLLMEFFDQMALENEYEPSFTEYRVRKDSMGIIFESDTEVDVEIRYVDRTVIPVDIDKCDLKVTAVNGISTEPRNQACKPDDCISPTHESYYGGVKSKG